MRSIRSILIASATLAMLLPMVAPASSQGVGPPQIQNTQNTDIGAVITNVAKVPGTYTGTPRVNNNQWSGLTCANLWTASSGSPTETWSIEGFDAATASWYQIKAATAIASTEAAGITHTLTVRPSVAVGSLATNYEAQNAVLPLVWRIKDVVGSGAGAAGPAVTNKIGCNYIK